MRVLVVSHTYITPINRKKWQVFALLYPNIQINVLFPRQWGTTLFDHKVECNFSSFDLPNCKFISMKTFKSGNEVLYGYAFGQLFKLIKTLKPDLIHVEQGDNAFSYFQCILFSKLLRLKSKNIFFTWVNWQQEFSLKYKIFWTGIEKFNLRNSSGAFVGNADAATILRSKGFDKKICVLPQLGVDTDVFTPAVPAEALREGWAVPGASPKGDGSTSSPRARLPDALILSLSKDRPAVPAEATQSEGWEPVEGCEFQKISNIKTVGFIGRLVEEKGIFTLLDAFADISTKYFDWRLIYLGNGRCDDELNKQICEKNLTEQVFIQKTVPHDQVSNFVQNLDILVLPSFDIDDWREQFGHVLIEAMACKIPIIGSDAGEIPNIISDVGLVFKQKNIESLQDALRRLMLDEALRAELGDKGYHRAIEQYSHQAIADKTHKFWIEIMKGDNGG